MVMVGENERTTQNRMMGLFRDKLQYACLGNWEERENNRNIEEALVHTYLACRGYTEQEITMAVRKLKEAANNLNSGLYNANKEVYGLLRYGVNIKPETGQKTKNVYPIDWRNPLSNDFYIAEEVSIKGCNTKRPDMVVYVNGIALAVIELKRSTVSVSEGIRQNLDNQQEYFIRSFFTTVQLIFAGNNS